MLNNTGPKTDPCGTPNLIIISSEVTSFMRTRCDLPVKKLVNQDKTFHRRPISFLSILIKRWWSTVSNAALRSNMSIIYCTLFLICCNQQVVPNSDEKCLISTIYIYIPMLLISPSIIYQLSFHLVLIIIHFSGQYFSY